MREFYLHPRSAQVYEYANVFSSCDCSGGRAEGILCHDHNVPGTVRNAWGCGLVDQGDPLGLTNRRQAV